MLSSIMVITFALTFGLILKSDLGTGEFIASHLTTTMSITFLPLLFFIISTLTALGIGSAWGAMAVMIPIAIPMATSMMGAKIPALLYAVPIVLPTLSAVLAGSVAGINLSPIADIVVMASSCTRSYHIDHVKAQQVYMLPVFFASCVAFLCAGLFINLPLYLNAFLSLGIGLATSLGIVWGLGR